jgi:hypothetical protein
MLFIPVSAMGATKTYDIVDNKKIAIDEGKKCTLKLPSKYKNVKWSSNNKNIITVNKNGSLIAINGGKATVTAKSGNKNFKCYVTVNEDYTEWVRYTTDDIMNLMQSIIDGNVVEINDEYYCSPEYYETFRTIAEACEENELDTGVTNRGHILTPDAEFIITDKVDEDKQAKLDDVKKKLEAMIQEK